MTFEKHLTKKKGEYNENINITIADKDKDIITCNGVMSFSLLNIITYDK